MSASPEAPIPLAGMAGFKRNQWQLSSGISGNLRLESVAGFDRNQWQPSRGIRTPHDRARGETRAVCLWPHGVCPDDALPDAPSDRTAAHRDGSHPLGVTSGMVAGLWHVEQGAAAPRACHGLWTPLQCPDGGTGRDLRQWPPHGANLLCVAAARPYQL